MTKGKQKTSGGPKGSQRTQADAERRATYKSKAEREQDFQKRLMIGTAIVLGIVAVLFLVALAYDALLIPRQALVTVNDEEVSVDEFRNRVQFDRFQLAQQPRAFYESALQGGLSSDEAQRQTLTIFSAQQGSGAQAIDLLIGTELHASQLLDQIIEERIIAQKAEEFGVTAEVDEAKVQEAIERLASLLTSRAAQVTPSPTASVEPSATTTPLVSATPSPTASESPIPSETPVPTVCAENGENCVTATPPPTLLPTNTPTSTPETTETPTPTPLSSEDQRATVVAFQGQFLKEGQEQSGLSEDDIRQVFYYSALTEALRDYVTSNQAEFPDYFVDTSEIWVDARHILIGFPQEDENFVPPDGDDNAYFDQAEEIRAALVAGEPFAALAEANSTDTGSGSRGGSLGWAAAANFVTPFKDAVETLPLGEISAPVRSEFGYHIIQVLDRERRDVPEGSLNQRRGEQFRAWLDTQRLIAQIVRREGWQELVPNSPTYNDLLSDILPEYDPLRGFDLPESSS